MEQMQGQLAFPGEIMTYILGGNATFTLVSRVTGQRFTYKVKSASKDRDKNWSTGNQDRSTFFVSLLTGSDNENSYRYLGLMKAKQFGGFDFIQTAKSCAHKGSPSFDAFAYVWRMLDESAQWPSKVEFWHEGSCCRCGRKLTVPESVANGIGPECATKGFGE